MTAAGPIEMYSAEEQTFKMKYAFAQLVRKELEERLQKFAGVYQNTLANLGVKVMYADLRYPNGFAVRRPLKVNAPGAKAPEPATNKTGAA